MAEQYVIQIQRGTYEEQDVASLTFYMLVGKPYAPTPRELAFLFREIIKELCKDHKVAVKRGDSIKSEPIPAARYLDLMFEQKLHCFDGYDLFEANGWHTTPCDEKITKVFTLSGMNNFLRPDGNFDFYETVIGQTKKPKKAPRKPAVLELKGEFPTGYKARIGASWICTKPEIDEARKVYRWLEKFLAWADYKKEK